MEMSSNRFHQLTYSEKLWSNRINFQRYPEDFEIREIVETWGYRWAMDDNKLIDRLIRRSSEHCQELADEAVRYFMRFVAIDKNGNWIWLREIRGKKQGGYPRISKINSVEILKKIFARTKSRDTGDIAYTVSYVLFNGRLTSDQEIHHKNPFHPDRIHPDRLKAVTKAEHIKLERKIEMRVDDFTKELALLLSSCTDSAKELSSTANKLDSNLVSHKALKICQKYAEYLKNLENE